MIREVELNGKKYRVDTKPEGRWYPEIFRYEEIELGGSLAEVLKELTGDPVLFGTTLR